MTLDTLATRTVKMHPRLAVLQHLEFSGFVWRQLEGELRKAREQRVPFVRRFAESVYSANAHERVQAILELARVDVPAARDALANATQHLALDVRVWATLALVSMRDGRAVKPLLGFIKDPSGVGTPAQLEEQARQLRYSTFDLTAIFGPGGTDDVLVRLLAMVASNGTADLIGIATDKSEDDRVRASVVDALGLAKVRDSLPHLSDLAQDISTSHLLKDRVILAIGRIGDPSLLLLMRRILAETGNPQAVLALARMRDFSIVPFLLQEVELNARQDWVLEALIRIGTAEALAAVDLREARDVQTRRDQGDEVGADRAWAFYSSLRDRAREP